MCISVLNFNKISHAVFEISQFFQDGSCLPSWILKISKFYWMMGHEGPVSSASQISCNSVNWMFLSSVWSTEPLCISIPYFNEID